MKSRKNADISNISPSVVLDVKALVEPVSAFAARGFKGRAFLWKLEEWARLCSGSAGVSSSPRSCDIQTPLV